MIDFARIKQLYQLSVNLSLKDIQVLIQSAKSQRFEAGAFLMQEGSQNHTVYFIRKGLIRTFIVNEKGDEITTSLRWENQMYANSDVILFGQASRYDVQALEATDTLSLDYDTLQSIVERHPKLEKNRKFILQDILKQTIKHSESFILYSPEERYLNFVKNNPEILNRVPGKYIANILGITPVSLSRIRKRIANKQQTTT
ncbi:MAG: Crp/Fnr family transcriptional regulator [Bacteroidota bacterium]